MSSILRGTLKSAYFGGLSLAGYDRKLLKEIKSRGHIVILNLHQVTNEINPYWPGLKPGLFDFLVGYLKERLRIVGFRDLDDLKDGEPCAILSFDDGYYNFLENAVPILEKHGVTANLNIVPSCVESGLPMWNVRLYDFLQAAPLELINKSLPTGFLSELDKEDSQSKVRFGLEISRFLKNRPRKEREALFSPLMSAMDDLEFSTTRMLTADEIRSLSPKVEIGAHSYSHESMEFEEDSFFEEDFARCVRFFEEQLDLPLDIYAFPNGSYRRSQIDFLRENGIRYPLLVGEDYSNKQDDAFTRFTIYASNSRQLKFQALGFTY